MKNRIVMMFMIAAMSAFLFAGDIMRINYADGTSQDFWVSTIEKLTLVDYDVGDVIRVNNADGTVHNDSINTVDKLRFSDFNAFLTSPKNLLIMSSSSDVILRWDYVNYATEYLIYRSEIDPYTGFSKIDSTTRRDYQDINVISGNKYFYMIKARNSQ